jgi:hypothetical protein
MNDVREHAARAHRHFSGWNFLGKMALALLVLMMLGGIGFYMYRGAMYDWVDNYHFAVTYGYWDGKWEKAPHNGYVYCPFYRCAITTIDLRPMQVCQGNNVRINNCKQIHFDALAKDSQGREGWEIFVSMHGRGTYEGPGNPSSATDNSAARLTTPFSLLMMGYAYDPPDSLYPFVVIKNETGNPTKPGANRQ